MPTKKKKPRGRSYKKGERGGGGQVKGRANLQKEEREVLKLDKITLFRYATQLFGMSVQQVKDIAEDPAENSLKGLLAKVYMHARGGNTFAFNALMDRTIGPVSQEIIFNNKNPYAQMSDAELAKEKQKLNELCAVRLKQLEIGGMYYVNPPKDVTPTIEVKPDGVDPIAGNAEKLASGT